MTETILNNLPNVLVGIILGAVIGFLTLWLCRIIIAVILMCSSHKIISPIFVRVIVLVSILPLLYIMFYPDITGYCMIITFAICSYNPFKSTMKKHFDIYSEDKNAPVLKRKT